MSQASPPTRTPRVCMVAYYESPTSLPPMLNLGCSLAADGFEVDAICVASSSRAAPPERHAPGFTSRRLVLWTRSLFHAVLGHATRIRFLAAVQYAASYVEYVLKVLLRALRSPADLYEANDLPTLLPTLLAAKLRRRPVVYRAHELWAEAHPVVRFAGLWRRLDRWLVPQCDEVVTPDAHRSRIYRDEYGARRPPMTVRNCPTYRPPIRSARLREELERRRVPFSSVVLYQGLVDSMRCIEEIAEASRRFAPGVVLVVIGGGYGAWADPAARLAGYERIVVLPQVPYRELPPLTASADVGILLYRNDCRNNYYCAPNKLFEYMMMGLPVIAPRFPGLVPLVEGEEVGVCVDPERPEEIAAAVNRIAGDAEARARMSANGLRLSREKYNWEEVSRPLVARYRALLDGRSGPS